VTAANSACTPTGVAAVGLVTPFTVPGLVSVLWDALHPWRHGEPPERTREYLGYFQVKDVESVRDLTSVLPGQGVLPLRACGELLRSWRGWSGKRPGTRGSPRWTNRCGRCARG
jgi:sugar phosphate isomerase/epimerase